MKGRGGLADVRQFNRSRVETVDGKMGKLGKGGKGKWLAAMNELNIFILAIPPTPIRLTDSYGGQNS
jgi:hypothetical protein